MAITRIEEVYFGVEDVPKCIKFFTDWGLELVEEGEQQATFRTPTGQQVHLRPVDDPSLPPAVEDGSTVRQVIWGTDDPKQIEAIAKSLKDAGHPAEIGDDGILRTTDLNGFAIGVEEMHAEPVEALPRRFNQPSKQDRWNEPQNNYNRAFPVRICHCAFNISAENWQDSVQFYIDHFGFRITDQSLDMGTFMQAEGDHDQHTFLLCHRPNRNTHNHFAFEVRNFDEVIEGGNYMVAQGWREARRLGRHILGSNVFRFFMAPVGGRVEYAADMDRVDENYGPNIYTQRPPHHLWMLTSSSDKDVTDAQGDITKKPAKETAKA